MAIQVFCNCGNSLSVGVELSGKKVRCKGCGEVLRIPAVPMDESAEVEPTSGPDDYEVVGGAAESITCDSCGATASPEDTACLACGADLSSAGGPAFLANVPRHYVLGGLGVVALIVFGVLANLLWTSSRPGSYTSDGLSALDAENYGAAETAFKQALTYDSDYPGALIGLAQTGVASKNSRLIERYVKRVLKGDLVSDGSLRATMRLALADLQLEENARKDAASNAEAALEDDESVAGRAYALIGIARADEDPDAAIEALVKAQQARHKDRRVFETLSRLYQDREQLEEARLAIEQAVAIDRDDAELWLKVAQVRGLAGDGGAVRAALEQAIRADPKNALAHSRLARAQLEDGDSDAAVASAEAAKAIEPESLEVLLALGAALLENDRAEEALEPLRSAHSKAKRDPQRLSEAAFLLGRALIKVDKKSDGMRRIDEALRGVTDPALHLLAARIALEEAGQPNKAATILSNLIATTPSYEANVLLAQALARKEHGRSRHDTDIRKHLEDAIALDAGRREAPLALGKHEFESLRPAKAIEAFDRGLTSNARDAELLFFKGWACIRARRWDQAIAALKACLQVAPDHEEAKLKLDEAQEGKFYDR